MATFTVIPDLNLAPDAKIRSVDALAFRDNPIAIVEGDATAIAAGHQIKTAALEDAAVTHVKTAGIAGMMIFTGYKTGAGNTTLNNTISWRDRFITVRGGLGKDTNEAQARTWLPGGSEDNDIYYGDDLGASSVMDTTRYIALPFFMYSRAGGATYNVIPHIRLAVGVSNVWLWVNSGNGSLNIYSDAGNTIAWNLIVGYGPDQGAH